MYASEYCCYKLFEESIKPDTEFLWIEVDFDDTDPNFHTHGQKKMMCVEEWKNHENDDQKYYRFYAPVYTEEYATKAQEAIDYQKEIQADVDSIRSDDDQYDDPTLWYADEQLAIYKVDGLYSELFWEYNKF